MASKYGYMAKIGADTSGIKEALKTVEADARNISAELKVVNDALRFDGTNVENLQNKFDLTSDAIENTKKKLENLRLVEEKVNEAAANGDISEAEQRAYQREIANTESKLRQYQTELNTTAARLRAAAGDTEDVANETKQLESTLDNAGDSVINFGDLLKSNIAGDLIADGLRRAAEEVKSFISKGIELASDLTEVQNVVDTTFGDGAAQIYTWADAAEESFGISSLAAQQYTGTMGAMLKSMGLTQNEVANMSTAMVGLAGDMASFHNLDVKQAFEKIRSGISGETEPLKQLGINMSVANLEAYALSEGIEKAYKNMTEAEKATLRYNYLMSVTADAQGDFVRTADSFANQQRIAQLNMENMAAALGEKLLPQINELTSKFNSEMPQIGNSIEVIGNIIGKVTSFALEHHKTILSLATAYGTFYGAMKAGNAIQTTVAAVKSLTTATQAATTAQQGMNAAAAANPYVLLASALAAVTVGLITFASKTDEAYEKVKNLNEEYEKIKQTTAENIENSEAEIVAIEKKAQKYEELLNTENRTLGQEEQLKNLAEELQKYMPEGTRLIDEQAGSYNSLADSIDSVIAAMRKKAKTNAYEDELEELYKKQREYQKTIEEMEERKKEEGYYISAKRWLLNTDLSGYNETKSNLEELESEIISLENDINQLYEDSASGVQSGSSAMAKEAEARGKAAALDIEERKKALKEEVTEYETALNEKVADLDKSLKLRKISEEKYYSDLKKYLDENANTESVAYYDQLKRHEDYLQKQADASKKLTEEAEKERVALIKSSWDRITADRDRGNITEADEYKLKSQLVKQCCNENEDTWDSYYKWLYDYVSKNEKEIAEEQLAAWEKSSKALSDTLADKYGDLVKQKEQVKKELLNIDLSETVTGKDGKPVEILTDLDAEIKKIDKYKSSLDKLKSTGISDSLLEKINGMSYEDGSRQRFINTLLGLSEDKRKLYYSDWEKLQEKSESVSQGIISDKQEELNKEATSAVEKIFGDMPETAYAEGAKTAQSYLQGIIDGMGGVNDLSAISGIFTAAYSGAGKTGAANSGTGEKYILGSTPITINLNDKQYIETTIQDLIDTGTRTGGNTLNL
ncbi:MAG: hypothetical protein J6C96_05620 [Oscillospiraceae bacterium]|nr:hypothetical protein [Oscillospiraceae bacterium]